jgi:hypothetical protein
VAFYLVCAAMDVASRTRQSDANAEATDEAPSNQPALGEATANAPADELLDQI